MVAVGWHAVPLVDSRARSASAARRCACRRCEWPLGIAAVRTLVGVRQKITSVDDHRVEARRYRLTNFGTWTGCQFRARSSALHDVPVHRLADGPAPMPIVGIANVRRELGHHRRGNGLEDDCEAASRLERMSASRQAAPSRRRPSALRRALPAQRPSCCGRSPTCPITGIPARDNSPCT